MLKWMLPICVHLSDGQTVPWRNGALHNRVEACLVLGGSECGNNGLEWIHGFNEEPLIGPSYFPQTHYEDISKSIQKIQEPQPLPTPAPEPAPPEYPYYDWKLFKSISVYLTEFYNELTIKRQLVLLHWTTSSLFIVILRLSHLTFPRKAGRTVSRF